MGWQELSAQQLPDDQQPDLTPIPLPEPQPEVEPAEAPTQPAEAPEPAPGWQEPTPAPPVEEPAPQAEEAPAEPSPFGDHGLDALPTAPETPQQRLEAAIDSGDRYAVVQALAAMGVNLTDQRLEKFIREPGT
jgi:preprotein translocase subunit SecD